MTATMTALFGGTGPDWTPRQVPGHEPTANLTDGGRPRAPHRRPADGGAAGAVGRDGGAVAVSRQPVARPP